MPRSPTRSSSAASPAELGVELRELVFVDDTLENVHAAQACGLPAVFWHHRDGVDALREQLAEYGVEAR